MGDLLYALKISGIGISVVFAALILIEWILKFFGLIDAWVTKKQMKAMTPASEELTPETRLTEGTLSDETIAVMAAAIRASVGPARVKRIRYRAGRPDSTWTSLGRAAVMSSKTYPKKGR